MPTRLKPLRGVLRSLLVGLLLLGPAPRRAAEQLEVQLDGLKLPIDLVELQAWAASPAEANGDLRAWLDLLDPAGRAQRVQDHVNLGL